MNRSTNLLYKTNALFNISDSFGNSFSSLPNPIRGFQKHYTSKGDFHTSPNVNDSFPMLSTVPRENSYPRNSPHYFKQYEDFQKPASGGYQYFFPSSSLSQNQANSLHKDTLGCQNSTNPWKTRAKEIEEDDENSSFTKAFQKSQIRVLTNQQFVYPDSEANSFFQNQIEFSEEGNHHYSSETNHCLFESQSSSTLKSKETASAKNRSKHQKKIALDPKVERYLEEIEKHEMNSISLLNEVSGKLKKKIDYQITESSVGRTKIFDCICLIDNTVIGTKRGNSKQNSKAEAAKEGIRTILMNEKYLTEGAAIILSIQKANEKVSKQEKANQLSETIPSIQKRLSSEFESNLSDNSFDRDQISATAIPINDPSTKTPSSFSQEKFNLHQKSALYELNIFSRRLAIDPIWSFPFEANEDGEFEVSLQFGDLLVVEKGKKKQEAKKEAASKMIEKIKEAQKLEKPIQAQPVENKILQKKNESFGGRKSNDRMKALFQKTLKTNFIKNLQASNQKGSQPTPQEMNFKLYLDSVLQKYEVSFELSENLQNFFQRIMNYTSIITSNPKQIMLDAEKHLADYVRNCYLTPIGSFALGTLRNDKLIIDTLLTFKEVKPMNEVELLQLYKESLETCYGLDQNSGTNINNMKFELLVQKDHKGNFLEVTEIERTDGRFKIHVRLSNKSRNVESQNLDSPTSNILAIYHVQRFYDSMKLSLEELNHFRNLLRVMKIWMENSKLNQINSEILEVIYLNIFLTQGTSQIHDNVISSLKILQSEELIQSILSKFDQYYLNLYQELSDQNKRDLIQSASQSLKFIFKNEFANAQFF